MPSFFPGMDPYLEAPPFWGVLHGTMITSMMGELKKRLPPGYSVWSDIYIWLHEPDADKRLGRPDVFMTGAKSGNGGLATLTGPAVSILPAVRREGSKYLKIKEARSERVITVVELLSPNVKVEGEDREAYLAKRNEYLATGTNLVELDFHRAGPRMPMGQPAPPAADYYALVSRAAEFPRTVIWPISVRETLPSIPIPLKAEDQWVELPLQPCFSWSYDQGPYEREVDYSQPPVPPLRSADAEWARHLSRNR
ncbi:MAG: DUF4058 family protein [Gemmataceae bacterium]